MEEEWLNCEEVNNGPTALSLMKQNLLKTTLGRLRIIGFTEGMSFIILLCIAMPLKYVAGRPEAVKVTGMIHGVLFVLYVLLVIQATIELGWSFKKMVLALLASLIPLGTFYADVKLFRDENQPTSSR